MSIKSKFKWTLLSKSPGLLVGLRYNELIFALEGAIPMGAILATTCPSCGSFLYENHVHNPDMCREVQVWLVMES